MIANTQRAFQTFETAAPSRPPTPVPDGGAITGRATSAGCGTLTVTGTGDGGGDQPPGGESNAPMILMGLGLVMALLLAR